MTITFVDIFIIIVLMFFFFRGWRRGFLYLSAGFISFIIAFLVSVRFVDPLSTYVSQWTKLPQTWSVFLCFFLVAFIVEAALSGIMSIILTRTPPTLRESPLNRAFGAIFSAGSGLLFIGALLFFILLVPVRGTIKESINNSVIAPIVLTALDMYGGPLPRVLNDSARKITQFITISPTSTERLTLPVNADLKKLRIDYESEGYMLTMINEERQKNGIEPLKLSLSMQDVARAYSNKMFIEKFFSHQDAQGNDVADRLFEGGVRFLIAGENLAYAPDVVIAHQGLMQSEGHRKNMLDAEFTRIGIGIIDAGVWGKMFTQVFAD